MGNRATCAGEIWNPKDRYLYDRIRPDGTFDPSLTVNPIVLLLFGMAGYKEARDILTRIESDFLTPWGVRTRSAQDPESDGGSYHKGNVWGLTTG